MVLLERFLKRMEFIIFRQPLDRYDVASVRLNRQHDAGANRLAIIQDRAAAADPMLAARMGSREREVLTDKVREALSWLYLSLIASTVERKADSSESHRVG